METSIDEILATIKRMPKNKRIDVPSNILHELVDYIKHLELTKEELKSRVETQRKLANAFMAQAMSNLPDKFEVYA